MGTRKSRVLLGLASALGTFRSAPVFGNNFVSVGDEPPEPEQRILPEGIKPQNVKLNKAEAKRYRKAQTALRNQTRVAAGMVC